MTDRSNDSGRDSETGDSERFRCVVCGASTHDGDGWIFPIEDSEVVAITENGVERELTDNPRPICSIKCKDEFLDENHHADGDTLQPDGGGSSIRQAHEHVEGECGGGVTYMNHSVSESFANDPSRLGEIYCYHCDDTFPKSEFVWLNSETRLDETGDNKNTGSSQSDSDDE